jgi:hypothetical protein
MIKSTCLEDLIIGPVRGIQVFQRLFEPLDNRVFIVTRGKYLPCVTVPLQPHLEKMLCTERVLYLD